MGPSATCAMSIGIGGLEPSHCGRSGLAECAEILRKNPSNGNKNKVAFQLQALIVAGRGGWGRRYLGRSSMHTLGEDILGLGKTCQPQPALSFLLSV